MRPSIVEKDEKGLCIRIKAKAKSAPAEEKLMERIKLNKTINMCVNFRDVFALQFGMLDNLVKMIKEKIHLTEGETYHEPRQE